MIASLIKERKLLSTTSNSGGSGFIIFEIGKDQHKDIEQIMIEYGFKLVNYKKDLSGIIRCLVFKIS